MAKKTKPTKPPLIEAARKVNRAAKKSVAQISKGAVQASKGLTRLSPQSVGAAVKRHKAKIQADKDKVARFANFPGATRRKTAKEIDQHNFRTDKLRSGIVQAAKKAGITTKELFRLRNAASNDARDPRKGETSGSASRAGPAAKQTIKKPDPPRKRRRRKTDLFV